MKDLFSVSGKVAVVTGGSSGIGAMITQGLVEHGARVYITARKVELLEAMAKEMSALGECVAIPSAEIASGTPTRTVGTAEDAAGTALYLCSRASNYVCGHTIAMDGGVIANAG